MHNCSNGLLNLPQSLTFSHILFNHLPTFKYRITYIKKLLYFRFKRIFFHYFKHQLPLNMEDL